MNDKELIELKEWLNIWLEKAEKHVPFSDVTRFIKMTLEKVQELENRK